MDKISTLTLPELKVEINTLTLFVPQVNKGIEILSGCKTIASASDVTLATENIKKAKTLFGAVDKEIERLCRPFKDTKKSIDAMQKQIKDDAEFVIKPLKTLADEIETNILAFNKKERERVALENARINALVSRGMTFDGEHFVYGEVAVTKEKAISMTAEEFQASITKLDNYIKESKANELPAAPEATTPIEAPTYAPPVVMAPVISGLTKVWKYEIIDADLVPREYCSPDAGKLQTAVKTDKVREIPGVRIWEDESIRR